MITVEEIESACELPESLIFPRHEVEAPELTHEKMFYPYGFPIDVKTNSPEILTHFDEMWGVFGKIFETPPIRVDIHVVESQETECPPAPSYRLMMPLMAIVADVDNYGVADLAQSRSQMTLSRAAMRHPPYLRYFFLDPAASLQIERFATPLHAGCVALNGRGVLLLGDSGAGKSTLSYACARAGWTYVTDDSSMLFNRGSERMIIGYSHQMRFRPSAADMFPELQGLEITPRATGKPSIEMPTALLPNVICAQMTRVNYLVFLNRRVNGLPELVPYRKDIARYFMRQILFGTPERLSAHYAAIEQLLTAEVFELRYSDLDWAVQRLETLTKEGR
jgi:hypothetical protein